MKEIKTFFDKNNRLNKGYAKIDPSEPDSNIYRKKFQHLLPPLDIISQYEDIHPGTLARLIAIVEQEQKQQNELAIERLKNYEKATRMGRIFALFAIALIAMATLLLWLCGGNLIASVFCCSAFATITAISISGKKKLTKEANNNKATK